MNLINKILKFKFAIILLLIIIFLLFFFRLFNLTIFPIFADEAIYIRWSQIMRAEQTLRFLPLSDGKQPLFMWLVMPFLSLIKDPLIAGRIVSVFSGFFTLIGIVMVSWFLFKNKWICLISGFFYAIIPFAVFFDRLALVDSLLTTTGIWFFGLAVLLVKHERFDLAIIAGLVLGSGLITKSPALFYALMLPSTILLIDFRKNITKNRFKLIIKRIGLWVIVYGFAFAVYNILRLGPNFHLINERSLDYVFSLNEIIKHPLDPFLPHLPQVWSWFVSYINWPVITLFIIGLFWGLGEKRKEILLLAIWFFLPLISEMVTAKVFTARYLFFIIPYGLIVSAYGFFNLHKFLFTQINKKIIKYAILAISVGLVSLSSISFNALLLTNPQLVSLSTDERSGYLEAWTSGYGINEVRDYLNNLQSDKQIIVGTEGYFGTLPDGLMIYFDKNKKVTIIGIGLGLSEIPNQLVDSSSKGNPTYLVINRSRIYIPNHPRLKLIFEVPKAYSQNQKDSLMFFQVL